MIGTPKKINIAIEKNGRNENYDRKRHENILIEKHINSLIEKKMSIIPKSLKIFLKNIIINSANFLQHLHNFQFVVKQTLQNCYITEWLPKGFVTL